MECKHDMPKEWCAICNGDEKSLEEEPLTFKGLRGDND